MVKGNVAKIEIIDSVNCKANASARELIKPLLKYNQKFYKKSRFGGKHIITTQYLITGRSNSSGTFLTGFLRRIKKTFKSKIQIIGKLEKLHPDSKTPYLKNIIFREDQLKTIRKMKLYQRGLIVYPTGSGKTIICFGFLSMFLSYRILFLCHTLDLIYQASEELNRFDIKHQILTGSNKLDNNFFERKSCFLLSTVQSFSKISPEKHSAFFDVIVVDEVHKAANTNIQYSKILELNLAPIRIGLTATIPVEKKRALVIEGLFGSIIGELKSDYGNKIGIIAKVDLDLLIYPKLESLANEKTYQKIYQLGIVENKLRNNLIIEVSLKSIAENNSVLIIVEKLAHGEIIQNLFREIKINVPFVQGVEDSSFRNKIKSQLKSKEIKLVIATRVWKEGINIPSLNHVVYAAGGKDELSIRQYMGRGLRIAKDKRRIKLTDFMDHGKYLAEHSVARFAIYKKQKWI